MDGLDLAVAELRKIVAECWFWLRIAAFVTALSLLAWWGAGF